MNGGFSHSIKRTGSPLTNESAHNLQHDQLENQMTVIKYTDNILFNVI